MQMNGGAARTDDRFRRKMLRQQAFIIAARSLFLERGYRGTTVGAIIARAGGSRETFYKLFKTKHGVFGAIIAEVGKDFADWIAQDEMRDAAPPDALLRLGLRLMTLWISPEGRAIHRLVASEGFAAPELMRAWFEGGAKLYETALSQYFTVQMEAGALVRTDPVLISSQFQFLLMGELTYPMISGAPPPFDHEAAVKRCVILILRAFGVPQPPLPPIYT